VLAPVAGHTVAGASQVHVTRSVPHETAVIADLLRRQHVFGQVPWSDMIRNEAGIATMCVGNITTADQVNTILSAGRADLVALARPHLTNPFFTMQAAAQYGVRDVACPPQYRWGKDALLRNEARNQADLRDLRIKARVAHDTLESARSYLRLTEEAAERLKGTGAVTASLSYRVEIFRDRALAQKTAITLEAEAAETKIQLEALDELDRKLRDQLARVEISYADGRIFAPPAVVEARKKEIEGAEHDPENFPEAPATETPAAKPAVESVPEPTVSEPETPAS